MNMRADDAGAAGGEFDGSEGFSLEDLGLGGGSASLDGDNGTPPSGVASGEAPATQAPSPAPVAADPAAAPTPAVPGAAEPWNSAPKSWKADFHQYYAALDPAVKQYIHQREEQALRGLMEYKQKADQYEQPFAPYRQVMEQAGLSAPQLVANFANNHAILAMGSPEQKVALAKQLLSEYGIDPRALIFGDNSQPQQQQQLQLPPEIARLPQAVSQIQNHFVEQRRAEIRAQIDKFASDHPHFSEVEAEMAELINSGAAKGLDDAYEIAVYRNPTIRQKILADQIAQSTQAARQAAAGQNRANSVNLRSVSAAPAAPAAGSIDDTLNAVASKHFAS